MVVLQQGIAIVGFYDAINSSVGASRHMLQLDIMHAVINKQSTLCFCTIESTCFCNRLFYLDFLDPSFRCTFLCIIGPNVHNTD